jgi:ABC-type dipeptide/oligopeptide/nickel transport system ATPase subunit
VNYALINQLQQPLHTLNVSFLSLAEQQKFFNDLTKEMLQSKKNGISIIYPLDTQVSLLSVSHYLFTRLFSNKEEKKQVDVLLAKFQLQPEILKKRFAELTYYESILIQLIRCLLLKQQQVIITDFFDKLTVSQIQKILPLLKKTILDYELAITLITQDQRIIKNPLIDHVLVLT